MNFANLESFTFKNIFKHSDKYLIGLLEDKNGKNFVIKVALQDNFKLNLEKQRMEDLNELYPTLKNSLCQILGHKFFSHGFYEGKTALILEHIQGKTFSSLIQDSLANSANLKNYSLQVHKIFQQILSETNFHSDFDLSSYTLMKNLIETEFNKIIQLPFFQFVKDDYSLNINNVEYGSLADSLEKLLNLDTLKLLNNQNSFITLHGHCNFHGDNILICQNTNEIRIIDPDVSINEHDPYFTLARFFYTYIHDTADYQQYLIETNLLNFSTMRSLNFDIKILWPAIINQHYQEIFGAQGKFIKLGPKPTSNENLRINLNFLYCLLRGVNANYEEQFFLSKNNISPLRHKSLLLLLNAIQFTNQFYAAIT